MQLKVVNSLKKNWLQKPAARLYSFRFCKLHFRWKLPAFQIKIIDLLNYSKEENKEDRKLVDGTSTA